MSFIILQHTGTLRMSVKAKTLDSLFKDVFKGIMEIIGGESPKGSQKIIRKIRVSAFNTTDLLADFIKEVIFLAHKHKEIYTGLTINKLTDNHLEADIKGVPAEKFVQKIKANTCLEKEIIRNKRGDFEAVLVFEI